MTKSLKDIRLSKNLFQRDIVERCNISIAFYSLMESGYRNPSMKTAKKIALCLGITLDEFYEALQFSKGGDI